ncbi:hypothetical protein MaudMau93_006999 [Microsporum audouinii]
MESNGETNSQYSSKTPRGDELKHLFGVGEVFLEDPRNGITLWRTLEQGLDNGTIAIIPALPTDEGELTRWKCILANQALREQSWTTFMGESYKWKELDGKELTFLTDNRSAKRYCRNLPFGQKGEPAPIGGRETGYI